MSEQKPVSGKRTTKKAAAVAKPVAGKKVATTQPKGTVRAKTAGKATVAPAAVTVKPVGKAPATAAPKVRVAAVARESIAPKKADPASLAATSASGKPGSAGKSAAAIKPVDKPPAPSPAERRRLDRHGGVPARRATRVCAGLRTAGLARSRSRDRAPDRQGHLSEVVDAGPAAGSPAGTKPGEHAMCVLIHRSGASAPPAHEYVAASQPIYADGGPRPPSTNAGTSPRVYLLTGAAVAAAGGAAFAAAGGVAVVCGAGTVFPWALASAK